MEHCCLPIEVCELIIDASTYDEDGDWGYPKECATLRACALTCRAWRPRSLFNLYHILCLTGEERTRDVVKCLREPGDNLAINIRAIKILLPRPSKREDSSLPASSPYHLVPFLLAGLPQVIRSVETVSICGSFSDMPVLGRPTHGSDIFLKSYGYFQSVQTLELDYIKFDTFSYFARFITCFRALRHLDLDFVQFTKLNDYPPGPAKLKQYKLHALAISHAKSSNFCHIARWLLKADALSLLESLSYQRCGADLDGCLSDITTAARASLKHLTLSAATGMITMTVDCSSNMSLQTIYLQDLAVNSATFILSTISSRDLSSVKLQAIEADRIADVDALAAILGSKQFTSLPKLNRIHVEIRPSEKWHGRLAGTVEVRKQVVVAEVDGPFSKLRGVFGERLEAEFDWYRFY